VEIHLVKLLLTQASPIKFLSNINTWFGTPFKSRILWNSIFTYYRFEVPHFSTQRMCDCTTL